MGLRQLWWRMWRRPGWSVWAGCSVPGAASSPAPRWRCTPLSAVGWPPAGPKQANMRLVWDETEIKLKWRYKKTSNSMTAPSTTGHLCRHMWPLLHLNLLRVLAPCWVSLLPCGAGVFLGTGSLRWCFACAGVRCCWRSLGGFVSLGPGLSRGWEGCWPGWGGQRRNDHWHFPSLNVKTKTSLTTVDTDNVDII